MLFYTQSECEYLVSNFLFELSTVDTQSTDSMFFTPSMEMAVTRHHRSRCFSRSLSIYEPSPSYPVLFLKYWSQTRNNILFHRQLLVCYDIYCTIFCQLPITLAIKYFDYSYYVNTCFLLQRINF